MTIDDQPSMPFDPADRALLALGDLASVDEDDWLDGTIADQGLRLHRLLAVGRLVRHLTDALEQNLADSMETDRAEFPGGRLIRTEKTSSTWNGEHAGERLRDDLANAVAQTVSLDVATGEIDPMKRNVALATMRTAYRAIPSFSSLNKAGRDELGLLISDYRTYTHTPTVKVEVEEDET